MRVNAQAQCERVRQARPRSALLSRCSLSAHLGLALAGCASLATSSPEPVLTISAQPEVVVTAWTASVRGELLLLDGCLQIEDSTGRLTLVPPADVEIAVQDETVTITTGLIAGPPQTMVARLGDTVILGGGETETLDSDLAARLPGRCPAPYWIVGSFVPSEATRSP
jgi:hypothetical protein